MSRKPPQRGRRTRRDRDPRIIAEHFGPKGTPKQSFDTDEEALTFGRKYRVNPHAYECTFCGKWHISTTGRY